MKRAGTVLACVLAMGMAFGAGWILRRERMAIPAGARFVASTHAQIYHRPDCRHARRIPLRNRVWFRSVEEAQGEGCRPCRVCVPRQLSSNP